MDRRIKKQSNSSSTRRVREIDWAEVLLAMYCTLSFQVSFQAYNKSLCGKCSEHTEYKSHSVRRSVKHCNLHSNFRSKHVIKNAVRKVQRSTKAKVYSEAECEARGGSEV